MTSVEIPLTPEAQSFSVTLGGVPYRMRVMFNAASDACWMLDIGKPDGTVLLAGVPLLPGGDLLAQHAHMEWPGALIVTNSREPGAAPKFSDLGTYAKLYFVAK